MVIKAIIVSNITQSANKYNAQINEFLDKSKLIPNFELTHVIATEALKYIKNNKVDVCLFWDKDIYLAKKIAQFGIKVFNNIDAIYYADDKALTAVKLDEHHVNQPAYFVFPETFSQNVFAFYDNYRATLLALNFPLVVKHCHGSFGEQVFLAKDEEQLKNIIRREGANKLIAQSYVTKEFGVDYRVNVVGSEVLAIFKRFNKNDFRSNINQGGDFIYIENPALHETALKAAAAIDADFAGVDIVLDEEDEPFVIEVNSNMRTVTVNKKSKVDITLNILNYIVKNKGA